MRNIRIVIAIDTDEPEPSWPNCGRDDDAD